MRDNSWWPLLALAWTAGAVLPHQAAAQTLKQAVEQAVRSNPEVRASTNHRLAADEGLKQARAGYWPRVDVNAGIGRERLDNVNSRALQLNDTTFTRRSSSLTLSQMLFDGFAVKSEVARQQARIDASAHGVAATAEDVALRVAVTYLEVLLRQGTVAAAAASLEAHQHIYDRIKLRTESGVGRRADLYQAQGRLALAQANLRAEQSSLKDAETAYWRLVGTPPSALVKPAAPDQQLPASEQRAVEAARAHHPALRSAAADVAAANAQHAAAKAALWPRLDLELGQTHDWNPVDRTTNDRSVMLRLRYNLFHGGADRAHIKETGYQIQEADQALERTRRQVEESVSQAFNAYQTARDRLVVLTQYVESSEATRVAYADQFSIGQRTLLDLLNAEIEYFNASVAYLSGQYAELANMYRIYADMGQLLATLQVALPVEAAAERR
jgi:adhesin transport system outer membrane protein